MAAGTKLVLTFKTTTGNTAQISYNHAKTSAGKANVKALGAAMIANTEIYQVTLAELTGAKEVTTSENVYDLSDTSTRDFVDMNELDPEGEIHSTVRLN